jgi:uncharacterized membrane protein
MKNKIIYILAILFSVVYIVIGNKIATKDLKTFNNNKHDFYEAKVTKILGENVSEVKTEEQSIGQDIINKYEAVLLNGDKKDSTVIVTQTTNDININNSEKISINDKIIVVQENVEDGSYSFAYVDRLRSDILILLGSIFFVLLLLFGKSKGFNTIISLLFTIMAIFFVYVPAILSGKNIYIYSIITCIYIIISTLVIVYGINKKSLATAIGCFSGILLSSLIMVAMTFILKLTGIVSEESVYLLYLELENPINLKAIIFGSVLIGAIGAIMDVAVDISASLREISYKINKPSFNELFKSGITIGKDIMGTMTNTLILAYIGSSLSSVLLITAYNNSMLYVFNKELIVVEILQALIGSIGLIFTIPFTSFICAILFSHKKDSVDVFSDITSKNIKK